jgi:hypothetical protein
MIHKSRRHNVEECPSIEAMARRVHGHNWCGCVGFKAGSLYMLNDSFQEGGSEFAVIRHGVQLDSLTVNWYELPKLIEDLKRMDRGEWPAEFGACAWKPHEVGPCTNDAFHTGDDALDRGEIFRVVLSAAEKVPGLVEEHVDTLGRNAIRAKLLDCNGNTCGFVEVTA